ncbi:MAG: flagellar biosynthesis anti-sigma factor FlgM [Burkholderiales bacterium]|nr:flagellar biosynthesis anti-sigma factor FlgM [Burkholderiales bacterium]
MKIGSPIDPYKAGNLADLRASRKGAEDTGPSSVAPNVPSVQSRLASSGVNEARLEAIKAAIRNGELKVNAEVVADRLLKSVLEMLGRKH